MNPEIYLLLGTNQGNRRENLMIARNAIVRYLGPIKKISRIYKTAAWGKIDQPEFFNQVASIESHLAPDQLLKKILDIENDMGRIRTEKWGPRIIDIDILFYHDEHIQTSGLTIPHPGIAERRFTLVPLSEIAPEFFHPVHKKSVSALLLECTDTSHVEPVS